MPGPRMTGTPVRYTITAIVDVWSVGGGSPELLAAEALSPTIHEHYAVFLEFATARFTRRTVEQADLVSVAVTRPDQPPAGTGGEGS